jgi:hypothetical protein
MFNLINYSANVLVILTEGGKYFALLVLAILAIRLWQRWSRASSAGKASGLVVAGLVTVLATVTGYVSMRHSLARMDAYFGMKAFDAGHLPQAVSLFEASERNWASADTMARRGVCLLYLGAGEEGLAVLKQARDLRQGEGTSFEFVYEGLYRFGQGDAPGAIRFLRAAAKDSIYRWTAVKTIAVIELDQDQVAAAAEDMKPFMQVDVTDFDQAYVLASLELAAGHKAEARTLFNKFPASNLGPRWDNRFDKLRARLQD